MTKYMHLLSGKPATFFDGQLLFTGGRSRVKLCDSLKEIRRQQKQSRKYRVDRNYDDCMIAGYVLVDIGKVSTNKGESQ